MQPTPVAPVSSDAVLNQEFAAHRVEAMRSMGAKNMTPPLARSAFLKNIKTGLVLPWSEGLAEQRDIMVNCDADGNTEPEAWVDTVNPVAYDRKEQEALLQEAMSTVSGYRKHEILMPDSTMNAPVVFPHDSKPLDEFMAEKNAAIVAGLDAMLE